jgi:DNA polymerase-3 subunit alpha
MPDIDIDFDDEGRGRVMDYVIKSMVQIRWLKLSLMVRWRPNRQFEIPLVYWIYLFEADRIAKIDSGDDAI